MKRKSLWWRIKSFFYCAPYPPMKWESRKGTPLGRETQGREAKEGRLQDYSMATRRSKRFSSLIPFLSWTTQRTGPRAEWKYITRSMLIVLIA